MAIEVGTKARVRPKVIEGDVEAKRFCPETGALLGLRLAWTDDEGEDHHRWFAPDQIEVAEPAEAGAPEPA